MSEELTKEEIKRIEEVAHELALILNNVKKPAQINRIQRDLETFSQRYRDLTGKDLAENVMSQSGGAKDVFSKSKFLSKITIERASPHCEYHDINLISSIIREFEEKYWPVLSDRHTKFDFSHAAERDTFFSKIEELKRNLKLILEYIEEMHQTSSQDYLSRLRTMRAKQERIVLLSYRDFFHEANTFLLKIVSNMDEGGGIVLNSDDIVQHEQLESGNLFHEKNVKDAVKMVLEFTREAEDAVNVPEI